MENTHNRSGGRVLPLEGMRSTAAAARSAGLRLHLDGARLWNASVKSGIPEAAYAELFDSVGVCLSKGLGAPVGSLICGDAAFVDRARYVRKRLGGGMRQVGIIAAAGLHAVQNHRDRLKDDHDRAQRLAGALKGGGRGIGGRGSHRFRRALMATQVALAVVLLVGAGLFVKSFARLQAVAPGFDPDRVLTLRVSLPAARYPDRVAIVSFHDRLRERLMALAGVRSAGAASGSDSRGWIGRFEICWSTMRSAATGFGRMSPPPGSITSGSRNLARNPRVDYTRLQGNRWRAALRRGRRACA